jgi:hypothetical protein
MSRNRPYKKPFVVSKKVFSLTSQPCDVQYVIPGPCSDTSFWYWDLTCDYIRKSPPDICIDVPVKPIFQS